LTVDVTTISAPNQIAPEWLSLFKMESRVMRNRLSLSFWGLHITAEGVVAIVVALLIVMAVIVAARL
jgi:hypothetical protein